MAASVEPAQLSRLDLTSTQMQALINSTRSSYHRAPSHIPRRSNHGGIIPSHHACDDEDDAEHEDWRDLYGSQLQLQLEPAVHDARDEGTTDAWIKRNPSLIRLTGKHPLNCEPPLPHLMRHGFLTPAPLHYVRNHGGVPRGDWSTWTVEVSGLVARPARLTMDDLAGGLFPAVEVPVTLVCSSNRRKEQNMARQTLGFHWGPAAVSTSVWRGARLRDVLRRCGVVVPGAGGAALNVCFEGADELPGGGARTTYGTSIRYEWAMDPTMDVMLAYMQNGEPLLPDHGFPVVARRWTRVEVTLDGGETWLQCELNHPEKPTKYGKYWCWCFWSVKVEVLDLVTAKEIAVRAWDQSLNTQPEKLVWNLMVRQRRSFGTSLCFFLMDWILKILHNGSCWQGMMNNCWFKVKVNVWQPHKAEIGLVFEHPTQPGNNPGGWMSRQKQSHLDAGEVAMSGHKRTPPNPTTNTTVTTDAEKQFTMSEVQEHASRDSTWIVVHGHVYDCTNYLKDHPGGADSILINAGTDITDEFDAIHSDKAKTLLDAYRIGKLVTSSTSSGHNSDDSVHCASNLSHLDPIPMPIKPSSPMALSNPNKKISCRLVSKKELSHDVRLFRFSLPSPDQLLGLPVGKHIMVCATIDGKLRMRAYTPTSSPEEVGHFDLLVKIYFKNVHPKFPNGGLMTQHLDSLPIGSCIDVKGPLGHVVYAGCGGFVIDGTAHKVRRVAMIAGGSGIAPVYQVIQAVLRDQPEDTTEMHLVYANRTEDDILLRDELDRWAEEFPERLKVWYVVDQVKRPEEGWEYSVGFVTEDILREHVPEGGGDDTVALACGPPAMIELAISPSLEKMNYRRSSNFFVF
ncbi:hypothetical protein HU200_006535 [Digitaria exilis]|uniref:Nitrate reductase n=1 Tax=Digitaria exilis TaxID=1010633 RepID=A0A835FR84_9POAL|nr:hypothetical protein HU200_006535 [Digitaria exilis]